MMAVVFLLACGGDDDGGDGQGELVCDHEYACSNGDCECRNEGTDGMVCCDPVVCGQDDPDSCTVACEVCHCTGGSCEDDGGDGDGAGDACWAECTADHATCTDRCGPGPECWDACTADHATCAERCD
jgi:hypothetical protein